MNALKSQFEGKCLRLERELKELRETQVHSEQREEPLDQSGAKVHTGLHQNMAKVISVKPISQIFIPLSCSFVQKS